VMRLSAVSGQLMGTATRTFFRLAFSP